MNWTIDQRLAIDTPGNLIVSAAAGAGKTAVLTERLFQAVYGGTPVERLLVLTFTRAAAAEMKERMERRLLSAAESEADAGKRAYLIDQATSVARASISTIDAFAARIVKRHGHLLGLPPKLRVLDELESAALSAQLKDALLTRLASEGSQALTLLLRAFSGEDAAFAAILRTMKFLDAQPYPEQWLAEAVRQYESEAYLTGLLSAVAAAAREELETALAALKAARACVPPEWQGTLSLLDEDIARLSAIRLSNTYADCRAAFLSVSFAPLRFPRLVTDAEKAPIRAVREAVKDSVKSACSLLARTEDEERALLRRSGKVLSALAELTLSCRAEFADMKRKRLAIDYADMEHMALSILDNEEVAAEYREKYAYIAVDEYQDTNRVNEAILLRICRRDNLFLVGDVKQSIYRFRQAEPALFLEKLARFEGEAGSRVDLVENFRSGRAVIAAVNQTFSAIMSKKAGEIAYDGRAALTPGAALPPGRAELHVVERAYDAEDDSLLAALDAEVEALLAADCIRRLMAEEEYIDPRLGRERPLQYGDFTVLMRGMNNALSFAKTLSAAGIPAYAEATGGYFEAVEVLLMLSLLAVIDNRRQDIPLIAVMRCALFDFSDAELSELRARRRKGPFFQCVLDAREENEKVAAFLDQLDVWRADARRLPVSKLIASIYDETGFPLMAGAAYGGSVRTKNLEALIGRAEAFERAGGAGLCAFLTFMENVKSNASIGAAQTAGANVVRILSMHKSKGLEFPVAILSGLGSQFNQKSCNEDLLLHGSGGLGLRFFDETLGCRADASARRVLSAAIRREQLAEEMRILYVAMTRARHGLIMLGCLRNAEETAALLAVETVTPYRVLHANSMLQWLLLGGRGGFSTSFHPREAFLSPGEKRPERPLPPAAPEAISALSALLDAPYEKADPLPAPAKAAVSTLDVSPPAYRADPFQPQQSAGPAARGASVHALLSILPLAPLDEAGVEKARSALPGELKELADVSAVLRFVSSPLYQRMLSSPRVERELPFSCALPGNALYPGASGSVLMQGVIDCCFIEDGGWTLIDYKTDRLPPDAEPAAFAEAHRTQLSHYAKALQKLTGIPVKRGYIALLSADVAVQLIGEGAEGG